MKAFTRFLQLLLLLLAPVWLTATAAAQNDKALTFTVGTTYTDPVSGKSYAYILWQPGDPTGALDQRYAIYRKTGDFNSPALFARLGETQVQSSQKTIRSLLRLGGKVDAESDGQWGRIRALYAAMLSSPDEAELGAGVNEELDAAEKLSYLIRAAASDPVTLERLFLLGRMHPGVMMALGHGFLIEMPSSGLYTYEVREISGNPAADLRVTGRVKLDASLPDLLPAPGRPVAVPHAAPGTQLVVSPKDHLNVRLRWGVDDDLRLALPRTHGFNVYRIPLQEAEDLGFDVTPPTPSQIDGLLVTGTAVKVNRAPTMLQNLLTPADAVTVNDPELYFMHDDGEVRTPEETSFKDGDQFYYFVAARDIIGRIGEVSQGTLVTICDRLPTAAPEIIAVVNQWPSNASYTEVVSQGGEQYLQVRFKQLENSSEEESAGRYAIYRWENHKQYIEQGGNPNTNLVGWVDHDPNKTINTFDDNGSGAPTLATKANKTVWYTIRAEDTTSCAVKNLSQHSPPKPGVLRDRRAPGDPTGEVIICSYPPDCSATFNTDGRLPSELGLDPDFNGYEIEVLRRSRHITAFEIVIEDSEAQSDQKVIYHRGTYYFRRADTRKVALDIGRRGGIRAAVRVRNFRGEWSGFAYQTLYDNEPVSGSMPVQQVGFEGTVTENCRPTVGIPRPVHQRLDGDFNITGLTGTIALPAGTAEWRIYRRVGRGGELQLVDKEEGDSLPSADTWEDPNPPSANGTIVCYYGQVFNAQGTPSELVRFGECVRIDSANLGTPMLLPVEEKEALPSGELVATLKWFCDPVGVERFEIFAAAEGSDDPGLGGDSLSPALGDGEENLGIGEESEGKVFQVYQSPRLVGAFAGGGGEFTLDVVVPADQKLFFTIRAVGPGAFGERSSGGFSNIETFRYVAPPEEEGPVIPWPARDLPSQYLMDRTVTDFTGPEGPFYAFELNEAFTEAAGILIGLVPEQSLLTEDQEGNRDIAILPEGVAIDDIIFQVRAQNSEADSVALEPLGDFMVYRYQVPSSRYPNARPNLLQVSPLIDRYAYRMNLNPSSGTLQTELRDPFLGFQAWERGAIEVPIKGRFQADKEPFRPSPGDAVDAPAGEYVVGLPENVQPPVDFPDYLAGAMGAVFWKDPMPVAKGARYRYLIVRFDDRGEIRAVIPTNPVQH